MAGKILADIIEAPAGRISLNVGNTVVASINASGLYTSTGNLLITQANQIGTAALPAGTVLQVVQVESTSASKTTTSNSFVTTGTAATITPSSASNKILVQYNCHGDTNSGGLLLGTIYRGATNLGTGTDNCLFRVHDVNAGRFLVHQHAIILDSPSTTSAVTYTVYFSNNSGAVEVRIRDDLSLSRLVLMEIAA
jgi:hypothetical protein